MVDFLDKSCCKPNLVAVGRIAARRAAHQLFLGKLAPHSVLNGHCRVCRACDTHRLIDISTAGKRVTDGSAKAGCRAAERLDFRRVVMCLVLEVYKPFLCDDALSVLLVNLHRHDNRAGIYLIRLFHILEPAVLFELAHRHERQIH